MRIDSFEDAEKLVINITQILSLLLNLVAMIRQMIEISGLTDLEKTKLNDQLDKIKLPTWEEL